MDLLGSSRHYAYRPGVRELQNLTGWVGSGRVGSGRVSTRPDRTRPDREDFDPTREKPSRPGISLSRYFLTYYSRSIAHICLDIPDLVCLPSVWHLIYHLHVLLHVCPAGVNDIDMSVAFRQ